MTQGERVPVMWYQMNIPSPQLCTPHRSPRSSIFTKYHKQPPCLVEDTVHAKLFMHRLTNGNEIKSPYNPNPPFPSPNTNIKYFPSHHMQTTSPILSLLRINLKPPKQQRNILGKISNLNQHHIRIASRTTTDNPGKVHQ